METQTQLSRHNKFISVENITTLSISSDDHFSCFSRSRRAANVELQFVFRRFIYIYIYIYIYI